MTQRKGMHWNPVRLGSLTKQNAEFECPTHPLEGETEVENNTWARSLATNQHKPQVKRAALFT